MATLINAILFQLTWFGCVLGAATGQLWWGVPTLAGLVLFSAHSGRLPRDVALVACLVPLGWMLERFWIAQGVLVYETDGVPVWIAMLWAGVALTVNHSLGWFRRYPFCGAALAALAAPLCYMGGSRLDAVVVPDPLSMAWVSVAWFAVFYGVFRVTGGGLESERPPVTVSR